MIIQGSDIGVRGSGFGVRGSGFGVRGSGFGKTKTAPCPLPPAPCPLIFLIVMLFAVTGLGMKPARANDVVVSNGYLVNQNVVTDTYDVQFDIAWENSWRISGAPSLSANWDAAWIFVKYSVYSAGTWSDWSHATLLNTGYVAPSGSTLTFGITGSAYKGAFLYSSATALGAVDWNGVKLRWDYGADGITDDSATLKVKIFAVEMVYIPEGDFWVGDGNGSSESNYAFHTGTGNSAVQITTTLAGDIHVDTNNYDDTVLETGTGIGIDGDGGLDTNDNGAIENANFPTGYSAFYIMKYEISQGQYRDFLNNLTAAQADLRYPNQNGNYRHSITRSGSPAVYYCDFDGDSIYDESTDGEWIACNYLSWADGAAYADWAGLRPMTGLEFEKAARGGSLTNNTVFSEYAWGTTGYSTYSSLSNSGLTNEQPPSVDANLNYSSALPNGPIRVGAFAGASTTRVQAGASYYGVMELSGNLSERPVTLGNVTGRSFDGTHGDGLLDVNADATNSGWPGTDAVGSGRRGGNWYDWSTYSQVSYRSYAANTSTNRYHFYGFRAARTP